MRRSIELPSFSRRAPVHTGGVNGREIPERRAEDACIFLENPEPRCPCVLLLDTSYSMRGQPIAELNKAVQAFKDELVADELAAKRVEVAIMGFGPASAKQSFVDAGSFIPPTLEATGSTLMDQAIVMAADLARERQSRPSPPIIRMLAGFFSWRGGCHPNLSRRATQLSGAQATHSARLGIAEHASFGTSAMRPLM